MPRKVVGFSPRNAQRVSRTVQRVERTPSSRPQKVSRHRARGAGSPFSCRVKQLLSNWLRVRRWDGETEGTRDIYVAKPYKLRHDADNYAGITSLTTLWAEEVEASDGEETERWRVTPSYEVDDVIYVQRVAFTGVVRNDDPLRHLDVNVDGRAWAAELEEPE